MGGGYSVPGKAKFTNIVLIVNNIGSFKIKLANVSYNAWDQKIHLGFMAYNIKDIKRCIEIAILFVTLESPK